MRRALLAVGLVVVAGCNSISSGVDETDGTSQPSASVATPTVAAPPALQLTQSVDYTMFVTTTGMTSLTGFLNKQYTCEGEDVSPQLSWEGVPPQAESLALILEDPASDELDGLGLWTHWIVYSIPPDVTELAAEQPTDVPLDNGAVQGSNDYGVAGYSGPCPTPHIWWGNRPGDPDKTRSAVERPYYFRLYALDTALDLEAGANREAVLSEIDGHIIAAGEAGLLYKARQRARINADCAGAALSFHEAADCLRGAR